MTISLPPPVAFVDSNLSNYLRWTTNRRPPDETALFTEPQVKAMIAAEREACAKTCEAEVVEWGYTMAQNQHVLCQLLADKIRARGAK